MKVNKLVATVRSRALRISINYLDDIAPSVLGCAIATTLALVISVPRRLTPIVLPTVWAFDLSGRLLSARQVVDAPIVIEVL